MPRRLALAFNRLRSSADADHECLRGIMASMREPGVSDAETRYDKPFAQLAHSVNLTSLLGKSSQAAYTASITAVNKGKDEKIVYRISAGPTLFTISSSLP